MAQRILDLGPCAALKGRFWILGSVRASQDRSAASIPNTTIPDAAPNLHRRSQILRLAEAHTLSYYDASYLELVVRLNGTLVSRDVPLVHAAQACGISCEHF